ncbi:hypothetical protein VTI74DRAFT_11633 [Chaetomium olivicolor]
MYLATFAAAPPVMYILFSTLSWFVALVKKKGAVAKEAARRGCAPAPVMPKKFLFGFGRLIENIWATRRDWGPQYVVKALDEEMGKDVHTVVQPIFDYEVLVSRDPQNIQAVLATQSQDWDTGEHRIASWKPLVGDGIFTSRGERWKHSRALVRPGFAMDQINDLDLFERHVRHLFDAIDMRMAYDFNSGWTNRFDLQKLFYNLALDVSTEMVYGYSVHSQNPSQRVELPVIAGYDSPDRANIGKHMDGGKAWIETRGALWKYGWLLPTGKFKKHCEAVHKYGEWFVQLRLQRGEKYLDGLQHQYKDTTKERYVLLNELAKVTQDPVELRSQTLNVLTAGRDTTAALMSWIFYFLARNRNVYRKLRKEVLSTFGPCTTGQQPQGFEFRKLRDNLPYMHAVINETLRMAPVVPLNERVALRDTVLPRGGGPDGTEPVFVPKGTQILIPVYALQMREDLWGDDVKMFRPERWLENGGRKFGFEFIPFRGGVRQCLGQQLARVMTAYVTCRILQRYYDIDNEERPPNGPIRFHHTIENRSGSGVWVRLREEGYVKPDKWPEHIPKRDLMYLRGEVDSISSSFPRIVTTWRSETKPNGWIQAPRFGTSAYWSSRPVANAAPK